MAGANERHIRSSERSIDKIVPAKAENELECAIPALSANARGDCVGDHRPGFRGRSELSEKELTYQGVKLCATSLGADESEFCRVFSKAVCVFAEELLQRFGLEVRSKSEPQQLALDAPARSLE